MGEFEVVMYTNLDSELFPCDLSGRGCTVYSLLALLPVGCASCDGMSQMVAWTSYRIGGEAFAASVEEFYLC